MLDRENIAKKLRDLRGERTQEEVSRACEISVSSLSMYENGERIPRDEVKKRLADYYKKSVQSIFYTQ